MDWVNWNLYLVLFWIPFQIQCSFYWLIDLFLKVHIHFDLVTPKNKYIITLVPGNRVCYITNAIFVVSFYDKINKWNNIQDVPRNIHFDLQKKEFATISIENWTWIFFKYSITILIIKALWGICITWPQQLINWSKMMKYKAWQVQSPDALKHTACQSWGF